MFRDFFHRKNHQNKKGDSKNADAKGVRNSTNNNDDPYGGNIQYKWNYDDYQKALDDQNKQNANSAKEPQGKPLLKNKGIRRFVICVCSIFAIAVLVFAGFGVSFMVRNGGLNALTSNGSPNKSGITLTDKPTSTSSTSSASTNSNSLQMSTTQLVSAVKKSVVLVETYDLKSVDPSAEGSGIISSSDGYIITNAHVVSGGQKFEIILDDGSSGSAGKSYDATLVGSDTRTDIAVLKINATGLAAATFGNSGQLQVGESVLAIGNPGGTEFSGTVTSGIISALNRQISANGYTQSCLQTDAPINPGNSGGALVNMYGQVIGITSSKFAEEDYEGMGFAIPINDAKPVVDSIIQNGYVTGRVKLGISVSAFTSYNAKLYNLPTGLIVASIDSASDAARQGMKEDDIITKINNVTIASGDSSTWYDNFYKEESKYKAGDAVTLTVVRYQNGSAQTLTLKVKLEEDKGDTSTSSSTSSSSSSNSEGGNGNGSQKNNDGSSGDNENGYSFFSGK